MRNTIIFHGTSSGPHQFWFPWLKKSLEALGYNVWLPQLPDADHPRLETWLPFVLDHGTFTTETVLVGHSAGVPLILSVLQNIDVKIQKAVLVAGYAQELKENAPQPIIQAEYDWEKIKRNCGSFIFINSDNDPWGCDDKAGRYMYDHLGGTLVIRHQAGHMGSERFNQPYPEFPFLLKLLESKDV